MTGKTKGFRGLLARIVAGSAVALLLTSCGMVSRSQALFGGKLDIQVEVRQAANQNSPIAVELLLVESKESLDQLKAMSAREWFAGREQFLRDAPKGVNACSWQEGPCLWEWVPGQTVETLTVEYKPGPRWGVIFADYVTPGDHRIVVEPRKHFRLLLAEESFRVTPFQG